MESPGDRFVMSVKKWLKDYSKTKFAIPTVIALTCLVYYAVVLYVSVLCFSNLIAPLFMLGMLWYAGVKRVKKLLVIGVIATFFFALILTVVIVTQVQHAEPTVARSVAGDITGTLDPWYVDKGVPFTFTLIANFTGSDKVANSAHVEFIGISAFDTVSDNLTMNPVSSNDSMYTFTLTTTTSKPINQFIFHVDVNGTWVTAGEVDSVGRLYYIQGPTYKDSYAVAQPVVASAFEIDFFYVFGPYAIILGMIWWTRRARRMRQKQIEKWQAEQAEEDKEKPKPVSKVPSLDAAMGKVEEGFVCSECGADVPADATVCPKCGEKFD